MLAALLSQEGGLEQPVGQSRVSSTEKATTKNKQAKLQRKKKKIRKREREPHVEESTCMRPAEFNISGG